MSEDAGRKILLATFFAAVATLTWSEMRNYQRWPMPSRYVGAGLTWGILGLLAPVVSYRLASVFGVGLYLTLLYQYFNAGKGSGGVLLPWIETPGPDLPIPQPQQTNPDGPIGQPQQSR